MLTDHGPDDAVIGTRMRLLYSPVLGDLPGPEVSSWAWIAK